MSPDSRATLLKTSRLFALITFGAAFGEGAAIFIVAFGGRQYDELAILLLCSVVGGFVGVLAELGLRVLLYPNWQFSAKQMLLDTTVIGTTLGVLVAMVRHFSSS